MILPQRDRPAKNGVVSDYFCFSVPVCGKFLMKHGNFYIFQWTYMAVTFTSYPRGKGRWFSLKFVLVATMSNTYSAKSNTYFAKLGEHSGDCNTGEKKNRWIDVLPIHPVLLARAKFCTLTLFSSEIQFFDEPSVVRWKSSNGNMTENLYIWKYLNFF